MDTRARHALTPTAPRERPLVSLGGRLPRVGLDGVLDHLDRVGERCPVPGDAAGDGFTWDDVDRADPEWMPQGIASLRSGQVLLVSWYARRRRPLRTRGSRLTVVDRSDPDRPRYAHVLLTSPVRVLGVPTLWRVPVHAGGIAVLGDLLYVADTVRGVRVFRLSDVLRVPRRRLDAALPWATAGTRTLGRRPTGGYTAYGFDHVLPELMRLRLGLRSGAAHLRCSFLSVGQVDGTPSLVVGEYGRAGTHPRLVRYALDPATGLPVLDPSGRSLPVEVHEDQPRRMQGVAVDGLTWVVSASAGEGNPGDLHVGAPGRWRRHRGVLPTGPEDLDWSVPGAELWGLTEWPGRRFVFPVDATRWAGGAAEERAGEREVVG